MKTFLNVLYRRILYKIPLKLLLVLIAVFGVLFACFSNAENVATLLDTINIPNSIAYVSWTTVVDFGNNGDTYTVCFNFDGYGVENYLQAGIGSVRDGQPGTNFTYWNDWNGKYVCFYKSSADRYLNVKSNSNRSFNFYGDYFILNDLLSTTIPVYSSLQCQTEYNLIPISSVDQNYCTTNNLCPAGGTPSDCPNVGVSNVFINDLFHPGAFNIIMNIPDEIDWDYAYTNSGQNMNIDVVGYNVDYEKIDQIVQLQNYKPTSEDFQKIIGLLAPYTKIIVFFVFLFIVWAWIKKPFKSKKL